MQFRKRTSRRSTTALTRGNFVNMTAGLWTGASASELKNIVACTRFKALRAGRAAARHGVEPGELAIPGVLPRIPVASYQFEPCLLIVCQQMTFVAAARQRERRISARVEPPKQGGAISIYLMVYNASLANAGIAPSMGPRQWCER